MNENTLVKFFGYIAPILHGDTAVFDRWLWLRKNIRKGKGVRTLDAGCGSGAFAFYAAKCGNEVVGLSFDERNNNIATERAALLKLNNTKFITMNLNDIPARAAELGKFDQIICFETIEHILKDQELVKNLSTLLHKNGTLLLTTPYKYYNMKLLGDDTAPPSLIEDGGHVRPGYTHEEIEHIFREGGLTMEKQEYVTGLISQLHIRAYRILQAKINFKIAWILLFPFRLLIALDPLIMRFIKFPPLSIAVVGKK